MPTPKRPLKVFLCYTHIDKVPVKQLYDRLVEDGVDVWMDKEKLFGGSNWEYEIRKAVRECDIFVVCVSQQFTKQLNLKRFSQTEVGIALDEAALKPKDEIYIIPVRLEECKVPKSISPWHWVDLFDSDGYQRLVRSLNRRIEQLAKLGEEQPEHSNISIVISGNVQGNIIVGDNNTAQVNVDTEKARFEAEELERLSLAREIAEKAIREKAERDAAEKARLEAEELERQRLAKEKADREAAEKATREKAEKDTAEKARLEAEEAERRRLAKEKAEREAVEKARLEAEKLEKQKAAKEKADREAAEKARRDNEKREEIETKPEIQKPQDNSNAMLWVVGGILVIILVIWLSSLNGAPSTPVLTSTRTPLPQDYSSNTPTKVSTPTAYVGSLPIEITDDKGVPMRLVPAGEFTMGSENGASDEQPVHTVYLDDFYMDKYEVTNALYKVCVEVGGCTPPQNTSHYDYSVYENHPVIYVDWNQAKSYCEWRGASLPTEAQWEKAARGTDERTYPWGEGLDCDKANYCKGDTTQVGSYENGISPYGIYDLAGNVWEWTADWYSETYYQNSPAENPLGPDSGQYRVWRGGSWNFYFYPTLSASYRGRKDTPDQFSDYIIGFRCARSP